MIKKSNPELKQAYDGRLATLTIDSVVCEDSGEYTCAAKNAAGEVRCSCVVTVAGTCIIARQISLHYRSYYWAVV